MPAYQSSFNLWDQNSLASAGRSPNTTTDYYSSLNRPNGTANLLGGTTAYRPAPNLATTSNPTPTTPPTGTSTSGQGWQSGQDAVPYLNQYLNGRNPYGESGFNLENALANATTGQGIDPRLYNYGYTKTDFSEGGSQHVFNNPELDPRGLINRNGQQYAQVGESINRIIDPTKVEYDPKYGLITTPDNIHNPESNFQKAIGPIIFAALGGAAMSGPMGLAGGTTGGAEGLSASQLAAQQAGATGAYSGLEGGSLVTTGAGASPVVTAGTGAGAGGTMTGLETAYGTNIANTGAGAAGAGGTVAATTGAGATAAGATGAAGTTAASSLPFGLTARDLATGASGLFNLWNSRNTTNAANNAANRADTWGEDGRKFAKEKLLALMNDPSSIENTPGYQFARSQGEQGINRAAAGKGYFRSPNMLFDLSKFNQGLAEKTWNSEWEKYAKMAGIDFNPSTAANIQMNGNQQSTNMRAAGISQLGSSFFDWLGRTA